MQWDVMCSVRTRTTSGKYVHRHIMYAHTHVHTLPCPKHNHKHSHMHVTSAPYPMCSGASLVVSQTLKGSSIPARKWAENLADASTRIDICALQKTIEFSLKRLARFYSRFIAGVKEPFIVYPKFCCPSPPFSSLICVPVLLPHLPPYRAWVKGLHAAECSQT